MKNLIIKTVFCTLLTFGLFYLLGAFYSASFNISDWTKDSRFIISVIGSMFSILVAVLCLAYEYQKKDNE
jgi:biotin transporter BioY